MAGMSDVKVSSVFRNGIWLARACVIFTHKNMDKEECAGEAQNQDKGVAEQMAWIDLEKDPRYQYLLKR